MGNLMRKKQTEIKFSDMISCLRQYFVSNNYKVLDSYKGDIHLPVDLICTIQEDGIEKICVVIVASVKTVTFDFQKMLWFYQYYLAEKQNINDYKIILVVPHYAKIERKLFSDVEDNVEYVGKEDQIPDFYNENGIGIWRINEKREIVKGDCNAITIHDRIYKDFKQFVLEEFEDQDAEKIELIKNKGLTQEDILLLFNDIHLYVDKYIHDSVKGITAFHPPEFDKRLIDGTLLENVLNVRDIWYRDCICEGISHQLSYKKDDIEFCTKELDKLWKKYLGGKQYPAVLKKFELILREFFPKYRDHYVHQFQVFLLGSLIIDGLIEMKKIRKKDIKNISTAWMLAASYHDFSYPIQRHDEYFSYFFEEILGVGKSFTVLEFKNKYIEEKFSSYLEHILASITPCLNIKDIQETEGTEKLNKIRCFLYHNVTQEKNHALLSALGLLKKLENKADFKQVLLPAAVAIALHDDYIWQPLKGFKVNESDKEIPLIEEVKAIAPLQEIKFEEHPLAFLLILCDNLQDWGRHCEDKKLEKELTEANIRLKDVVFESNSVIIKLILNINTESTDIIQHKNTIMKKLTQLLKSPKTPFIVEFWDRDNNQPSNYRYTIQ